MIKTSNLDQDKKNRLNEDINNYHRQIEDLKLKIIEADKLETAYEKKMVKAIILY